MCDAARRARSLARRAHRSQAPPAVRQKDGSRVGALDQGVGAGGRGQVRHGLANPGAGPCTSATLIDSGARR